MIPRFYNFALGNDSTAWKRCPGAETKKRVSVPAEGGSGFRLSLTRGPLWRCGSLRQKVLTERRLFAIIIKLWIWRCIEAVVTRTTRNRFVLNQIQTNLRLFYFALLLLGTQKHRQKPGRRCPFSPKFSPTGTLTGRLLNLLKILLFVETAVSLHPLEYVTSAADTISVPNGGRECKDVTPEPCCRVRIR